MSFFKRKRKTDTQKFIREIYTELIGSNPVVLYNYTLEDYVKRGYSQNDEIYSIIKKITDKANVATPYVYVDKEGVKSKQLDTTRKMRTNAYGAARHRLEVRKTLDFAPINNDLSKLIVNPNEMQTWRDFITLVRIFYFVQGEAFVYREAGDDDCALSLYVVPAHLVRSIVDNGILVGWQVDLMNGQVRNFVGDDMKAMLHLKMPNPVFNSDYTHLRGMSPLLAGLKYLQLNDDALLAWIKSVENEGAKGLISPNHADPNLWLTPEQVTKTQEAVEAKVHGYDNKNKLVVSAMPLQYTQIGLSPDALNIVNGLQHSGYKLCNLWGVPPELFNPNPTYQNQKEASIRLVTEVVLPYLNTEEDKLNSWLVEPFRKRDKRNYLIDYDLSAYEELRLSVEDTDMFLKTHTINEVRVMLGSDELDEEYANQVFVQQGLVPLSDYNIDLEI